MNLENIFYILGIVCFALFITANMFILALAIKFYFFARRQAEIIETKSQNISNLIDILTSQKTKAVLTFFTTAIFIFRLINKAKKYKF